MRLEFEGLAMEKIEFGSALASAREIPEFARYAEELGYDYLCSGEHMMFHGPITNSLISLSVAAGATSRIKLMSSIVLLPLYNPMVLAKMTSVLDVVSNGRYHLGVGIGGEFPEGVRGLRGAGQAARFALERGAGSDHKTLDRERM